MKQGADSCSIGVVSKHTGYIYVCMTEVSQCRSSTPCLAVIG